VKDATSVSEARTTGVRGIHVRDDIARQGARTEPGHGAGIGFEQTGGATKQGAPAATWRAAECNYFAWPDRELEPAQHAHAAAARGGA
jgi:hypothetical protein